MEKPLLSLQNLTKTYIIGERRNAVKAQKAIHRLEKKYERYIAAKDNLYANEIAHTLKKAQRLFAEEEYEGSYHVVTGKLLDERRKDRGSVVHALSNVNLQIYEGDLVAIVGPSGSGKSTLLNMLGLMDRPTAGQIFLKGKNVSSFKPRELPRIRSKELGVVFQSFNLIPSLTALENVMLPLRYSGVSLRRRKERASEVLEKVGLRDRLHHSPNELSGGQQQRVAIARSIVNKPAIVFGDELTGELDSKMTAEIMRLIHDLNEKGQTFILVTHNPEVAKACKHIIFMKDGRIVKEMHP